MLMYCSLLVISTQICTATIVGRFYRFYYDIKKHTATIVRAYVRYVRFGLCHIVRRAGSM